MIHATPPDRRSEFQREFWGVRHTKYGASGRKSNPVRKANLFGLGSRSPLHQGSRKEAYDAGYKGQGGIRSTTAFKDWYGTLPAAEVKTHHGSMKAKLRSEYERGVRQEHADHLKGVKSKVSDLKAEKKSTPKPPPPAKGEKSTDYKGLTIRHTAHGFEVKGEVWNTLAQAKEYADYWVASGGKIRRKTNAELGAAGASSRSAKAFGVQGKKAKPAKKANSYSRRSAHAEYTLSQGNQRPMSSNSELTSTWPKSFRQVARARNTRSRAQDLLRRQRAGLGYGSTRLQTRRVSAGSFTRSIGHAERIPRTHRFACSENSTVPHQRKSANTSKRFTGIRGLLDWARSFLSTCETSRQSRCGILHARSSGRHSRRRGHVDKLKKAERSYSPRAEIRSCR